jgi:hypothetical protein
MAYPRLRKLRVKVHYEPVPYVLFADIDKALDQSQKDQFNKLFGIQTCPCVEAGSAVYPWDAEAVLEVMASGKKTGTQLLWD